MLKLQTALGALKIIKSAQVLQSMAAFGINDADMRLMAANSPWVGTDRARVCRVMDSALYASMDIIGVPRFAVSSEYQAAMIYELVAPVNVQVACRWVAETKSAEDTVTDNDSAPTKPEALFVTVAELYNDESTPAPAFNKKTAISQEKNKQKVG